MSVFRIKSEQDEINNKKRNLFNSLDFNSTFENPTINSLPLAMDKFNQEKVDNQFNLKENTKVCKNIMQNICII